MFLWVDKLDRSFGRGRLLGVRLVLLKGAPKGEHTVCVCLSLGLAKCWASGLLLYFGLLLCLVYNSKCCFGEVPWRLSYRW